MKAPAGRRRPLRAAFDSREPAGARAAVRGAKGLR
jgi:hypothetical protein